MWVFLWYSAWDDYQEERTEMRFIILREWQGVLIKLSISFIVVLKNLVPFLKMAKISVQNANDLI